MWQIPEMWKGGECWIIGGGPSIPREFDIPEDVVQGVLSRELPLNAYSPYLSAIHHKHIIGVNAAFYLGSWVDIAFFGDGGFYFQNRKELLEFPNMLVSCNPALSNNKKAIGVKFIRRDGRYRHGISFRKGSVSWNKNSGAAAINLAVHLGAKRIYLLGFDMKLGEGDLQWWHKHYKRAQNDKKTHPKKLPFQNHLEGFPVIARDARRHGIEIFNISRDSAITNFPKITVQEALEHGKKKK